MASTTYYWDEIDDNVCCEEDENGEITASYTHEAGPYGEVIAQKRGDDARYFNFDGEGNTSELTDENANVTDTFEYTAFGEEVARTGTTENPFGYKGALGYYTNAETNDIYVRARTYRPKCGRWITRDPLFGIVLTNLYAFVRNSPSFVDASGLIEQVFIPGLPPADIDRYFVDCSDGHTSRWKDPDGTKKEFILMEILPSAECGDDCGGKGDYLVSVTFLAHEGIDPSSKCLPGPERFIRDHEDGSLQWEFKHLKDPNCDAEPAVTYGTWGAQRCKYVNFLLKCLVICEGTPCTCTPKPNVGYLNIGTSGGNVAWKTWWHIDYPQSDCTPCKTCGEGLAQIYSGQGPLSTPPDDYGRRE